jgi:hypothetical protein
MRTLADELMLLAITEKGDVSSSAYLRLDNGIAGAHLMELALRDRVRLDGEALVVADASPIGDEPADDVLATIAAEPPRVPKDWIRKLAEDRPHRPVVGSLRRQGVLTEERGRVLGIFKRTRNLEADPEPEREVRERLRRALVDGVQLDGRTAALASLVSATELLGEAFPDSRERRAAERRMEALSGSEELRAALGAANQATIDAMLVAVMLAVTAGVTAATAAAVSAAT